MRRRCCLRHLILAVIVVLGLTPLMIAVDAGAQIAFASDRDGDNEIYVMDADGGNLRRLTNNRHGDGDPVWSPDGKRIAFKSDRAGHFNRHGWHTHDIYVMDADGSNQQKLTNNPADDWDPSWSPDGKRIAFTSWRDGPFNIEVYVMDADGGNLQNLTNNPRDDRNPFWSPYGAHIVFSARRDGHFENKFSITHEVYVMDVDGGNQRRLTNNRSNDWDPVWSPDGKRIAFQADRKGNLEKFDIYVIDADGGNPQNLTNHRAWDGSPSWSPDGERIVFHSERDGNNEIYVMDVDGGNLQNLTNHPANDSSPAWYTPPFAVAPAGKSSTTWGWLKQVDQ